MTVFREVNKIFTRCILETYDSLKVLPVCMEGIHFDNYPQDQKLLYENHRKLELRETPSIPAQVLPFTQTDYSTSMPLCEYAWDGEKLEKASKEAYLKRIRFQRWKKMTRLMKCRNIFWTTWLQKKGKKASCQSSI